MGYRLNCLDEPIFTAVSKPLLSEFGLHHRLESCATLTLVTEAVHKTRSVLHYCFLNLTFIVAGYSTISSWRSVQPFVCEISDKDLRSMTASLVMGSYSCGYALTMILGAYIPQWRFVMLGFGGRNHRLFGNPAISCV